MYLDSNAHVPISQKAMESFINFQNTKASHGHPLSPSVIGRAAAAAIENSRNKIAKLIGAKSSSQIFFTNSCTQACEWVAKMFPKNVFALSTLEHPAMKQAFDSERCTISLKSNENAVIQPLFDFDWNDLSLPELFVCIYVQNEVGTIQPIDKMTNLFVISDMSQALGKIPVNVTNLDIDVGVFGAHKFGGPGGVGFIYLKDTNNWKQFGSGSRYLMDIPGTPDVASIVATVDALLEALETLDERTNKMIQFRDYIEPELEDLGFEIIGKNEKRAPNVTFVKAPKSAIELMLKLGEKDIHIGLGSACGSLYVNSSPLLKAIGRAEDNVQNYLRISQWGEYGIEDAKRFIGEIKNIL